MRRQTTSTASAIADSVRQSHIDARVITTFGQGDKVVDGPRLPADLAAADVTSPAIALRDLDKVEPLNNDCPAFFGRAKALSRSCRVGMGFPPFALGTTCLQARLLRSLESSLSCGLPYGVPKRLWVGRTLFSQPCKNAHAVRSIMTHAASVAREALFFRHGVAAFSPRLQVARTARRQRFHGEVSA